mmetsp:Transcript_6608/g.13390  ORF Transcript_6608/g.13390 Transcript_6608/m.13390 type:complete len:614 (-) Transcript_6608:743-2584(-)|eukprot:CAMPEP_0171491176 /NCGR_PEP_ID=MMETSP0958-20121227/3716_1 /TAXON_ID=87120 /ORGANISM="Aurantiochytrium limacinum, Strain ATCCMYA-1381" /LENGTH=613 /DNA_ID=CAMNT_0012024569 /DNA_START=1463 /DNA_END=3304 /DNA_ORIENTATION=+
MTTSDSTQPRFKSHLADSREVSVKREDSANQSSSKSKFNSTSSTTSDSDSYVQQNHPGSSQATSSLPASYLNFLANNSFSTSEANDSSNNIAWSGLNSSNISGNNNNNNMTDVARMLALELERRKSAAILQGSGNNGFVPQFQDSMQNQVGVSQPPFSSSDLSSSAGISAERLLSNFAGVDREKLLLQLLLMHQQQQQEQQAHEQPRQHQEHQFLQQFLRPPRTSGDASATGNLSQFNTSLSNSSLAATLLGNRSISAGTPTSSGGNRPAFFNSNAADNISIRNNQSHFPPNQRNPNLLSGNQNFDLTDAGGAAEKASHEHQQTLFAAALAAFQQQKQLQQSLQPNQQASNLASIQHLLDQGVGSQIPHLHHANSGLAAPFRNDVQPAMDLPVSNDIKPEPVYLDCPPASQRIKGKVYMVRGSVKRWDGKRFARCCEVASCTKLAQGPTNYCKSHGGGTRCREESCNRAARGGFMYCIHHGGGSGSPENLSPSKRRRIEDEDDEDDEDAGDNQSESAESNASSQQPKENSGGHLSSSFPKGPSPQPLTYPSTFYTAPEHMRNSLVSSLNGGAPPPPLPSSMRISTNPVKLTSSAETVPSINRNSAPSPSSTAS